MSALKRWGKQRMKVATMVLPSEVTETTKMMMAPSGRFERDSVSRSATLLGVCAENSKRKEVDYRGDAQTKEELELFIVLIGAFASRALVVRSMRGKRAKYGSLALVSIRHEIHR
jgi:hypothetical protein